VGKRGQISEIQSCGLETRSVAEISKFISAQRTGKLTDITEIPILTESFSISAYLPIARRYLSPCSRMAGKCQSCIFCPD